jgi:tetratricopeptide (TPR) repeat protein
MTINPNDLREYIECDECGAKNPRKRCSQCRCTFYCSVDCQKKDWSAKHKLICLLYKQMCTKQKPAGAGGRLPVTTTPVNTACGICLEDPIQQQVVLKACKHAFCFACLKDYQTYTTHAGVFDGGKAALSCPYCRHDIEKSVVEDVIENAGLYAERAEKLGENDPERKTYFELALAEVNKILVTDERHLGALCLKSHILQDYAPEDAIQVYDRILELDWEGSANLEKLEAMLAEVNMAIAYGDQAEAERLGGLVEAFQSSGACIGRLESGPHRLFNFMNDFAEAHKALGNWQEALNIYVALMQECIDDDPAPAAAHQRRSICFGTAKCLFQLGHFDSAITAGEEALALDRRFPGVHKLLALPQLALGLLEAARTTMRRAVVYENPWDDENRQKNIAFLEECQPPRATVMPLVACTCHCTRVEW